MASLPCKCDQGSLPINASYANNNIRFHYIVYKQKCFLSFLPTDPNENTSELSERKEKKIKNVTIWVLNWDTLQYDHVVLMDFVVLETLLAPLL